MTVERAVDIMNDPNRRSDGRFFGKYRGVVKDNKDPLKLGRIQASVPAVSGMATNWANPCAPYAGEQVGFYTIPPVGAKVWIEFEGGNPNFPIWSGCFWQDGEVPNEVNNNSEDPSQVKVFRTRVATLWIDDTDQKGQITLKFNDSTVSEPITITAVLNSTGMVITCQGSKGTSTITQTPEDIKTTSITLTTDTTKTTTFTVGTDMLASASGNLTLKASGNLSTNASGNSTHQGTQVTINASSNFTASANTAATVKGTGSATLQAANTTVSGDAVTTIKGGVVKIN